MASIIDWDEIEDDRIRTQILQERQISGQDIAAIYDPDELDYQADVSEDRWFRNTLSGGDV